MTFHFLLSLMGPHLPLWSSVNGAGSRTHEQLSRVLPPAHSGDPPVWIRLPAAQLPWEVRALLKFNASLWLQCAKSEAVLGRRESAGPGGVAHLLPWVQREVPNSCGPQGRFRGLFGQWAAGFWVTWQFNLTSKTKSLCLSWILHVTNMYCLDFIKVRNTVGPFLIFYFQDAFTSQMGLWGSIWYTQPTTNNNSITQRFNATSTMLGGKQCSLPEKELLWWLPRNLVLNQVTSH